VALLALAATGCNNVGHFLPKTLATSVSPDGRYTAIARRSFSIDPPNDHLFIATRGGSERNVLNLGPDVDWCDTIVWSPDSKKVGFAINDEQLAIFDAETGRLESRMVLTGNTCCGTAPEEARNIVFSADATEVAFDRIRRPTALAPANGREVSISDESRRSWASGHPLQSEEKNLGREIKRIPLPPPAAN
jgi:hypothetical protein